MTTLIKPTNDIPTSATKINGITNDMVKNSPQIDEVAQSFIEFIFKEKVIIGHNLEFDINFLYANGINTFETKHKYFDTLDIAKTRIKKPKNYEYYGYDVIDYKLTTLLKYYYIHTVKAHRSLNDCIGTGYLFKKLLFDS